jgi:F-type H+-transporting ATPase subunit alpha
MFAGSKGYIDAIETSKVTKFEKDLYDMLDEEKTVLEAIKKDKEIKEETETKLKEIIAKAIELNK